jgi:hypothetical protein
VVTASGLLRELLRGHVLQGAVWSLAVVVLAPGVQLRLGIPQRQEPVLAADGRVRKAFGAQAPVERFYEPIVSRISDPPGFPGRLKSKVTPFQKAH